MIRRLFAPFLAVHACVRKQYRELKDDNWWAPVVCSLALHMMLLLGFFIIMPSGEERKVSPAPSFVTAKVVTLEQPKAQPKPQPVRRAAPPEPVRQQPVKPPVAKPKPKPQPDQEAIALKRKQEEERQRAQAEQKRQEEARQRAEQQRREQERREQQRREQLQKQQEQEMLAALARERQAAAQAKADQQTVAGYEQLIAGLVSAQWSRPPSARRGMKVVLQIRLAPTGEVISIARISGSGSEAFDRSATQAVERAAPFREIQGMESRIFEQNFREFRFVFNPEDLLE